MSRAGREPAEDVKTRVVSSCRDAGLEIQAARMYLQWDRRARIVHVDAYTPEGRFQTSFLGITTIVSVDGDWSGTVRIRCAAAEDDLDSNVWDIPVMRGRDACDIAAGTLGDLIWPASRRRAAWRRTTHLPRGRGGRITL